MKRRRNAYTGSTTGGRLDGGKYNGTSTFERYKRNVWIYGVVATSAVVIAGIIILLIQNLS